MLSISAHGFSMSPIFVFQCVQKHQIFLATVTGNTIFCDTYDASTITATPLGSKTSTRA